MNQFIYLRLVVLTAGTLLPFFWMVVILGHRRQRNFERIFFFLCLSLVLFFGSSLLALNAELFYGRMPPLLGNLAWTALCAGLWLLPSLLVHLHLEYAQVRAIAAPGRLNRFWSGAAYLPAFLLAPGLFDALRVGDPARFALPARSMGRLFQIWLVASFLVSAVWQRRFQKAAPDREQKSFHRALCFDLSWLGLSIFTLHFLIRRFTAASDQALAPYTALVALFALLPLVGLIRNVQRFNFLQIGRQRNLIYAVFAAFLALLYFSLIRRASLWLDSYLPPEATAALLLFLPLAFFEPLQRMVGRLLRRTAQTEMDRAQRMMGPIQDVARTGDLARLTAFIEGWVSEQSQVAEVKLVLGREAANRANSSSHPAEEQFMIRQSGEPLGSLRVKPHGAMLSGETAAALEFLCEQLPGALDLCRLIEEKLCLERELAERERLALVGQMAASISHNLKNPLGSIKTILQVQLENPVLPASLRGETKIVLEEIGRLSSKLNQLLQFSRPAVRTSGGSASCDPGLVVEEVSSVLSHEAEKRGVRLKVELPGPAGRVAISAEALNDIVSNLVVNALEAAPRNGQVTVNVSEGQGLCCLKVEDDGPGIAPILQEKILQPFFTTKSQGTGLGLAIVARRAAEAGGRLDWVSPTSGGRGSRFKVQLPLATVQSRPATNPQPEGTEP